MLRYHGAFAANAKLRREVVPSRPQPTDVQLPLLTPAQAGPLEPPVGMLLKRVFAFDVTVCAQCGGRLRIRAIATDPDAIARVLGARPARARAPPPLPGQLPLDFQAAWPLL